jgi:hypothetical protein
VEPVDDPPPPVPEPPVPDDADDEEDDDDEPEDVDDVPALTESPTAPETETTVPVNGARSVVPASDVWASTTLAFALSMDTSACATSASVGPAAFCSAVDCCCASWLLACRSCCSADVIDPWSLVITWRRVLTAALSWACVPVPFATAAFAFATSASCALMSAVSCFFAFVSEACAESTPNCADSTASSSFSFSVAVRPATRSS